MRVQLCRLVIADMCQLQREEHSVAAAFGRRLSHPRQEPARRRIPGVLAVQEVRVNLWFRGLILVLFELAHHGREIRRLERRHPAFVLGLKRLGAFQRACQRCLQSRIGRRRIQVAELPANRLRTNRNCSGHGPSG